METGFKGNIISIGEIVIKGRVVSFRARFEDSEGIVHAVVNHDVALSDENPELLVIVRDLVAMCTSMTRALHFDPIPEQREIRGIAESISNEHDSSDEPGGPG